MNGSIEVNLMITIYLFLSFLYLFIPSVNMLARHLTKNGKQLILPLIVSSESGFVFFPSHYNSRYGR